MKDEFRDRVEYACQEAKAIAWDTCHKIYILLDDEQVRLMRSYGYDPIITSDEMSPAEMAAKIDEWYEESCGLRFVNSVETKPNPNDGFETIIGQFEDEEEDESAEWGMGVYGG